MKGEKRLNSAKIIEEDNFEIYLKYTMVIKYAARHTNPISQIFPMICKHPE